MEISWVAHSCFLIKTSIGKRILLDPFPCPFIDSLSDISIVTISHNHFDHNYVSPKFEKAKIIKEPVLYEETNISIEGFETFHDSSKGLKRGKNIIYLLSIDNFKICHLGDLGHIPNDNILEKLKNIDLLLIPVGGNFTLDGKLAADLCKIVHSNIIIPMHYKSRGDSLTLKGLEEFLYYIKNAERIHTHTLTLVDNYSYKNCVLILNSLTNKKILS